MKGIDDVRCYKCLMLHPIERRWNSSFKPGADIVIAEPEARVTVKLVN